jgi:hypothetical protein
VGLLAWAMTIARERRAERREVERLRTELAALRTASNECVAGVAQAQGEFEDYNERVDSLLDEVRDYEALDTRGVPGERYAEYLETFDAYNLSVPGWREQADSLSAQREACEALVLRHNTLADSVRRLAEARAAAG